MGISEIDKATAAKDRRATQNYLSLCGHCEYVNGGIVTITGDVVGRNTE